MKYDIAAIGKRLTDERKKHHLTKLELAEAIGYSDQRPITSVERGDNIFPLDVMLELCEIFDCELAYLLCEQDCKTRAATDICEETGLSEKAIKILHNQIDLKSKLREIGLNDTFPVVTSFIDYYIQHGYENMQSIMKYLNQKINFEKLKKDVYYNKLLSIYKEAVNAKGVWNAYGYSSAADDFYNKLEEMLKQELLEDIKDSNEQIKKMIEENAALNDTEKSEFLNKIPTPEESIDEYMYPYINTFETLKNNDNIHYFEFDIEKSFLDVVERYNSEQIKELSNKMKEYSNEL